MKAFFIKIWGYLVQAWHWIKWVTRKPSKRQYIVTECLAMPSLVDMKCYGRPSVNQAKMFMGGKKEGYRQLTPAHIDRAKKAGGDLEIFTKAIRFYADRIY